MKLQQTNETTTTLTWHATLVAVEQAHAAVARAHRAFYECPLGDTEELLRRQRAWWDAEARLERALLRERAARMKARGEAWLKSVL